MSRAYIKRTANDFGDTLTFNLQEADGSASDLSGQTGVNFHARLEGDVPGVDPLRISKAMTVVGPETDGVVSLTLALGDFGFAGLYFVQVEGIFPVRNITWDIAIVSVEEEHG